MGKFFDNSEKTKVEQLIEKIELYEKVTGNSYKDIVTSGKNIARFYHNGKIINLGIAIRNIRLSIQGKKNMKWIRDDTKIIEEKFPGLLILENGDTKVQEFINKVYLYEKISGQPYTSIKTNTSFIYNNKIIRIGSLVNSAKKLINNNKKNKCVKWSEKDIKRIQKNFPGLLDKKSLHKADGLISSIKQYEINTGKSYSTIKTTHNFSTYIYNGKKIDIGRTKEYIRAIVSGKIKNWTNADKQKLKDAFPLWFVSE